MKRIFLLLSAATLIISCSKIDQGIPDSDEMRFAPQHFTNSQSSANGPSTKATATAFEAGDKIGLFATKYNGENAVPLEISGNYANNSAVTFNGTKWTAQPAVFWADGKFDIYAYYPFIPFSKLLSVDEQSFSVALDQSTAETADALSGYEASDLLWAKNTSVTKMDVVPLIFRHTMSRLVVNLVKGEGYTGDIPADAIVRVHNTVPHSYVDLASGIVTKNPYESPKSITAMKVSNGVYAAIIVPQRITTRLPFVEILTSGVSYLIESTFIFKPATQHTINIILSNNPEQVKIIIGGELEGGWN